MKKHTFKSILFFVFAFCSLSIIAQDSPPSDGIFRLQNVATGKFLTDAGSSATAVTMTDAGEATNTHWTFVESGSYFNIDSEVNGILRAPGTNGPGGAYVVVSTTKAAPATDTDKTWTIYHNEADDTYRFESRTAGRFMYHNADGTVTHAIASGDDDRSKWEVISTSQSLSIEDNLLKLSSINIFPNPAENVFNIALNNLENVNVKIVDIIGKTVFESQFTGKNIQINNYGRFKSGIYLIKVIDNTNNVYHARLVIK